ncbi:phosphohydrolase [Actinoplanes sp. CA-142083]|uniref:phosphohydrolase n=1 Tax=Actinoplanes sp. CA-142083 TaxID=3239903 RepID=UPI003D8F6D5E
MLLERGFPSPAAELLRRLSASPRLVAHLRLVHDVAFRLTEWLAHAHPAVLFDREAVLFGAATHDIGKARVAEELSAPGSRHEQLGEQLLLAEGVSPRLARFAATHASWHADGVEMDDLLISLADKVWKAKRVPDLEQLVVDRLAVASAVEPWAAFMSLDDCLDRLAAGADERLAFQNAHPVS